MPRRIFLLLMALGVLLATASAFQYPGWDRFRHTDNDDDDTLLPDAHDKTEWAFAKLRYATHHSYGYRARRQFWYTDSPAAERHFARGVKRLTRIHTRVEKQVIDLDNADEVYNWPWLYAVEVGHWELTPAQCKKLRDYLDRGGFLMVDDFHGTREWSVFVESMNRVFPDRPIEEIPNDDPIYHVIYDVGQRVQIPGTAALVRGVTYEYDGYEPRWRCIRDDKGRVVVAICHNMDLGDAWEWADSPEYPERYTSMAYRIGVDYLVYAMTH